MRPALLATAAFAMTGLTAAAAALPERHPAAKPDHVRPDGAIPVIGNDGMRPLLQGLEPIVARKLPGKRYALTLTGSSTGLPALAAGATLFAPLAREAWAGESAGFKQIHGYDATAIRIGYSGWGPRATGKTPPAVYVGRGNRLEAITLKDLSRAFTMGNAAGDLSLWSQLGVQGAEGARRIHLYGVRDDGGFATSFRNRYFAKRRYALRYEPLGSYAEVLRAVAQDPYGIAITGWVTPDPAAQGVRILPIAAKGHAPATPERAMVAAGAYPLSSGLYFYVDKAPDKPLDPLVRAWAEAALSDEGQALIARQSDGVQGYLPLSPADLAAERAKLAAL